MSVVQAVPRIVEQLVYTPRQGRTEDSEVVVRVDVCLALEHALLEALPILLNATNAESGRHCRRARGMS